MQHPLTHQGFEAQAKATPDAIAVVFEQHATSYQELNIAANQLARYLRYQSVGYGTPVGICVEQGLACVVAVLAVLKAGGTCVPMSPALADEQFETIVKAARVCHLVTQSALMPRLPTRGMELSIMDSSVTLHNLADLPGSNVIVNQVPDAPAFILYPPAFCAKAEVTTFSHRALMQLINTRNTTCRTPQSFLRLHPQAMDSAAVGWCHALHQGGRLVVGNDLLSCSLTDINNQLCTGQVDTLETTAGLYEVLLEVMAGQGANQLKQVILTDEILSDSLLEAHKRYVKACGHDITLFREFVDSHGQTVLHPVVVDMEDWPVLPTPAAYVAPQSELEKVLVALWAELLKEDAGKLGINDEFYSVGGNSVSLMQLTNRLEQVFGVSVSLGDIFIHKTVAHQAELLKRQRVDDGTRCIVRLNDCRADAKMFFIHPQDGAIYHYQGLACLLKGHSQCLWHSGQRADGQQ